jgi:hypothetical protein
MRNSNEVTITFVWGARLSRASPHSISAEACSSGVMLDLLTNILISLHYYIITVFINSFAVGTCDVNLRQTRCDRELST